MANNNFPNFFSAPTDKADAEKKASKLISGLNADEKDELQKILGDRDKINAVLSSPRHRRTESHCRSGFRQGK